MTNHRRHTIAVPHVLSLSRKGFREDRGGFGIGETEAGLGGGESGGELRMIFAEVLHGDEDVILAGGVEPVMDIHQSEAEGTFAMGEPVAGRTS